MVDSERRPRFTGGDPSPIPRSRPRRRDVDGFSARWPLIVGASILMGVAVVFVTADPAGPSITPPTASPAPAAVSRGYLISVAELLARARRAAAGEQPYLDAVTELLGDAEQLSGHVPQPIQPLRIKDDGGIFEADGSAAYALALAYRLDGSDRFGRSAAAILSAWMDEVAFVEDACPDSGACHTSLIVSRLGACFVFAADLLEGTPFWTADHRTEFAAWLENVILPAASERTNNWGDAGTLLRVAITDYVGDDAGFARALDRWRALMDLVETDGTIPEEARRGSLGLQYTQEALQYKVAVAEIAGRRDIDLWSYTGARGGTLKRAIDALARYWVDPAAWPHDPAVVVPRPGPMWELAYAHWPEPAWVPILTERRPYGDLGHSALRWTTLTNGIPTTVVAGPGASPLITPTPGPTASPAPTFGEPQLRLASVPSAGRVSVGMAWPIRGAVDGESIAIRIERAIDGEEFSAVKASSTAGQEVVFDLPADVAVRFRVTVLDAGGGPTVWTDGPAVVVRVHDDDAPMVALSGTWIDAAHGDYVGGTAASSKVAGAVATVVVDAYAAMVIGPVGATRGTFSASIDGAPPTEIDTYRPRFDPSVALLSASWATPGRHSLRLEVLGSPASRPTVGLDAFVTIEAAR